MITDMDDMNKARKSNYAMYSYKLQHANIKNK